MIMFILYFHAFFQLKAQYASAPQVVVTMEENDKDDENESHDLEVNENASQKELQMESQVDKNKRMREKLMVSFTKCLLFLVMTRE